MSEDIPLRKLWQQIIENRAFVHLDEYDDLELQKSLVTEDRELLALVMAMHGEEVLTYDYDRGHVYLEHAAHLAPDSIRVHLIKGKAYSQLNTDEDALEFAATSYARASLLEPLQAAIWHQWGVVVMHLGVLKKDYALLQDAHRLLGHAKSLCATDNDPFAINLYWSWGQLWYAISRISGEPCDLDVALHYYRRVVELDCKAASFWNDYANALWEMAGLLKRPEVFQDVVQLYRKAIQLNPRHYAAQFNLGLCYQKYFEAMWRVSLFWNAHEQYTHCRVLNAQHPTLHLAWGRLLLMQGQLRRDADLLEQACDYLEKAQITAHSPIESHIDLAEAYLWYGSVYDDLVLINQAERKAQELLCLYPSSVMVWTLAGYCLAEIGHYFNEESYYRKALEKFNKALSLDRSSTKAWFGCASVLLTLGELLGDPELIKAALSHFEQAAEFDGPFTPQFWNEWGVAAMKFAEFSQEQEPLEFAIEKFETAIELDLTLSEGEYIDPEWLYNYGCAYDFLGDMNEDPLNYERSIALLQKVLEIDPDYLQARYNLAVAYSHLGEVTADIEPLKNACEHFHTLLAQDAEDEMAWNEWGLALINLGLLLCEEAQPGLGSQYFCEAESKLQQAAYLGYNVSFYNLACLCSLRGDYQAAIAYLERAENNAGMPPIEDVMQDIWLDGLRETEQFRVLLTHLLSKYGEGNAASG